MKKDEVTLHFRLWVLLGLVLLFTINISYQRDTIAAIRAVGTQCNTVYQLEIPEIEEIEVIDNFKQ